MIKLKDILTEGWFGNKSKKDVQTDPTDSKPVLRYKGKKVKSDMELGNELNRQRINYTWGHYTGEVFIKNPADLKRALVVLQNMIKHGGYTPTFIK